jgi:hypothetical protein
MYVDETLTLLRKHGVASATFDGGGCLLSVQFAYVSPPSPEGATPKAGSIEEDGPPLFRTAMHTAASVLQGKLTSMRGEETADA